MTAPTHPLVRPLVHHRLRHSLRNSVPVSRAAHSSHSCQYSPISTILIDFPFMHRVHLLQNRNFHWVPGLDVLRYLPLHGRDCSSSTLALAASFMQHVVKPKISRYWSSQDSEYKTPEVCSTDGSDIFTIAVGNVYATSHFHAGAGFVELAASPPEAV